MPLTADPIAELTLHHAPLTGAIERALLQQPGAPQLRARWLVAQLLPQISRAGHDVAIEALTLAEFDGCLAAIYRAHYGEDLPSEGTCTACDEPFEMRFALRDFQARLAQDMAPYRLTERGEIAAPAGHVFRLPCVADLDTLPHSDPDDWLRGLLTSGDFDAAALQADIAAAGPVLSQDIDAPCPHCGHVNAVRFDLADYLLAMLTKEAGFLWREVHLLARHYHWSLTDILDLPRDVRRQMVSLIVGESARVRLAS